MSTRPEHPVQTVQAADDITVVADASVDRPMFACCTQFADGGGAGASIELVLNALGIRPVACAFAMMSW